MVARTLLFALLLCLAGVAPAHAGAQKCEQPAGPLGPTLDQFARRCGLDIIYTEDLVRGIWSPGTGSADTPQAGLAAILRGSGLVARFVRADAIVLDRVRPAEAPSITLSRLVAPPPDRAEYVWYGQRLLNASLALLRTSADLADRPYDLLVYLWVDEAGRVVDLRVNGDAGRSPEADVVRRVLTRVDTGEAPPAAMPQPVGLRIASQ